MLSYLSPPYLGTCTPYLLFQIDGGFIIDLIYILVCKELSQAICGPEGSYCASDASEPEQFKGLPTAISKYPHTVGQESWMISKKCQR